MKRWIRENFSAVEWLVGVGISLFAILAWLTSGTIGDEITALDIFPILGLVAFGLMWSHYTLGTLRRWSGYERTGRDMYWIVSAGLVLALIILHPVLLNISLAQAGMGLPPDSWFAAYGQNDGWFIIPGVLALVVFLLFELHRWFKDRKWWKWVEYAQILAMVAIFVHATRLGYETSYTWYAALWWGMALTLVFAWVYNWKYDKAHAPRRGDETAGR